MGPFTLKQRLARLLIKPKQVLIIDGQSKKPARNMQVRPLTLMITVTLVLGAAFLLGVYVTPPQNVRSIIPQHVQLQRQYDDVRDRLAEAEALNNMKDQQIDAFEAQIKEHSVESESLRQRLRMLESILKARKGNGVQLLQGSALLANGQITYHLVLVKGGNYPRYASGYCNFIVQTPEGENRTIQVSEETDRLPYRMESHNFLDGSLPWSESWQPDILEVVLFDYKGREISRSKILIEGENIHD